MSEPNALRKLWASLAELLPDHQVAELQRQYAEHAAADRRRSSYRKWEQREKEALATLLRYDAGDYPDTLNRAQRDVERAQRWLQAHQDWK